MSTQSLNKRQIFHLDFNFISPRQDRIRALLAQLPAMGYDTVLWELEDQVLWETCPECAKADSWTKEEFRELLALARSLGLAAVPVLQTVGHGEYVMMHERYFSFREHPDFSDCYCTSSPEVRKFFKRWIEEICDLFGEVWRFHLGGDEGYQFGSCEKCRQREPNELYAEYMEDLASVLNCRGIRPAIWHDMVMAHPETVHRIPPSFALWDWNYEAGTGAPESVRIWGQGMVKEADLTPAQKGRFPGIMTDSGGLNPFYTADYLAEQGYEVVLCSAARARHSGPFCPNVAHHADNIVAVARKARNAGFAGQCVTSWAFRLNPLLAGIPLLDLAGQATSRPDASTEELGRETFATHLGFEKAWEAAVLLGECDYRVRIFSAVQWSGLKDSRPAPAGYLQSWIDRWIKENEPFWFEREAMLDGMVESTRRGLALLLPHETATSLTGLWSQAATVQLAYLEALREVVCGEPQPLRALEKLQELRAKIIALYSTEQTPASATKNAALLLAPLREHMENQLSTKMR